MTDLRVPVNTIKQYKRDLEDVTFMDVIKAATNQEVVVFDIKNSNHASILTDLRKICDLIKIKFTGSPITRALFTQWRGRSVNAFRNNEVGDYCEFLMKDFFDNNKKQLLAIKEIISLTDKGYPDLKAIDKNNETIYLEIKATSRPNEGSPRDFYFSLGSASERKINAKGLHILIGFITTQIPDGFNITDFKIVDISRIKVSLKPEFNADNRGIYNDDTLIYPMNRRPAPVGSF